MKTKDQIQREIIDIIVESDFKGIVLSSVRSGKTRILITAIKDHCQKVNPKVLVLYPNIDIKNSWINECALINCPMDITYSTFMSMEKVSEDEWDYVVFDEAHLIPEEHKLPIAGMMAKRYKHVIFASGTYNVNTLADLQIHTSLPLIIEYSTENAIEDGLISDYSVYVHHYELTSTPRLIVAGKKKWMSTDVKELNRLTRNVETRHGDRKMLASLGRMRFINSNGSLFDAVNRWIKEHSDRRFIMFTENETFALKFGLPMFNSKSKDDSVLKEFQEGVINKLCLIKKGSAGVTYPNLDNILITAINSNGETLEQMLGRALLLDTDKAEIHIWCTDRVFQLNWLHSALSNIPEDKITWIKTGNHAVKSL
jgi:superfamily II DNA or RNA helicase